MLKNIGWFVAAGLVSIATLKALPKLDSQPQTNEGGMPTVVDQAYVEVPQGELSEEVAVTADDAKFMASGRKHENLYVKTGSTVYDTLEKAGMRPKDILEIIRVAKPHKNLASISAKTPIELSWNVDPSGDVTGNVPYRIRLQLAVTRALVLRHKDEAWQADIVEAKVDIKQVGFSGSVVSTLWESAQKAGMSPHLMNDLADVFAWQVDFSREVQVGDRWRLVIEEKFVDGKSIGFGDVLAAEFDSSGVIHTGVRYQTPDNAVRFYDMRGESLRRLFLKSPLRFGRITSKFSRRRFHPILKINKPHLGVDYGAPTGTPVMSVGRGVVTFVGRRGGSGKTVKIRHNASYATAYKHLSKYGKGIKKGAKVDMGQVIGKVGSTGLATGPHLHFEFYKNGRVVDPLGMKFPSADPVPERYLAAYQKVAQAHVAQLPPWNDLAQSKNVAKSEKSK